MTSGAGSPHHVDFAAAVERRDRLIERAGVTAREQRLNPGRREPIRTSVECPAGAIRNCSPQIASTRLAHCAASPPNLKVRVSASSRGVGLKPIQRIDRPAPLVQLLIGIADHDAGAA